MNKRRSGRRRLIPGKSPIVPLAATFAAAVLAVLGRTSGTLTVTVLDSRIAADTVGAMTRT
jgi:hypothetical protein